MRLIKCYLESERGIKIGFTEQEGKEFFFSPESGIIYKWEKRKALPNEKVLHENTLEAFHISEIRGAAVNVAFFPGEQLVVNVDQLFAFSGRDFAEVLNQVEPPPIPEGHPMAHLGQKIFDDCGVGGETPPPLPEVGGDLPPTNTQNFTDTPTEYSGPQVTHSEDRPNGAPDFEGDKKEQESLKKRTKAGGNKRPKK